MDVPAKTEFNDRDLWPTMSNISTDVSQMRWSFSKPTSDRKLVHFGVLKSHQVDKKIRFHIDEKYAILFAYLDMVYWSTCADDKGSSVMPKLLHYLRELREAVVHEILTALQPSQEVIGKGWCCHTIIGWATRTFYSFGHSDTGRKKYMEYCNQLKQVPYQENPADFDWKCFIKKSIERFPAMKQYALQRMLDKGKGAAKGEEDILDSWQFLLFVDCVAPATSLETPCSPTRDGKKGLTVSGEDVPDEDKSIQWMRGVNVPIDVSTVTWKNGRSTILPWHSKEDTEMVKKMAASMNGCHEKVETKLESNNQYVVLQSNKLKPGHMLDQSVRHYLSHKRCVVIKGEYIDGPSAFSIDEITPYKGPRAQEVQYQDAGMRAKVIRDLQKHRQRKKRKYTPTLHKEDTLENFITASSNPLVCGNLLDSPALRAHVPAIICRIADCTRAFELMRQQPSHARLPRKLPNDSTVPYTAPTSKQAMPLLGSQVVRMDSWMVLHWNLITHAGFVTYPHKDANGFCTWLYANHGTKVWAILEPKYVAGCNRADAFAAQDGLSGQWEYCSDADMYTTFLDAGDLLIMPPGAWHAVFTATPNYSTGGHFLLYETLHLTEFSRAYDHIHGNSSTNANHQVDRILAKMTLSLNLVASERALFRRPILALARMILHPKDYVASTEVDQPDLPLTAWDLLMREEEGEMKAAQQVIRRILAAENIAEDCLQVALEDDSDSSVPWYYPGRPFSPQSLTHSK